MQNHFQKRIRKILAAAAIIAAGLFCAPLHAFEVFLHVGYQNSAQVYRIVSTDEHQNPVGYMFEAEPADAFFVDRMKNFRFLKGHSEDTFKPVTGYIYRQVLDGTGVAADWSNDHSQHQDQRAQISPDEEGRPVFRPTGAPFSSGPGQPVTEGIAMAALQPGECEAVVGKKWYKIPNASWYQTWFSLPGQARPSYKIYLDVWEEREYGCVESIWRGYPPGKVLERPVGTCLEKRFRRAQISGAMELIDRDSQSLELLKFGGRSMFHLPGTRPGEGELFVYTWAGNSPGRFFVNGHFCVDSPVFESQAADQRFAGCGFSPAGARRLYVVGTDILQVWLQASGIEAPLAECSKVVFTPCSNILRTGIFVYSEPENRLYCFTMNDSADGVMPRPRIIELNFKPASLNADINGDLYLTAIEKSPRTLESAADFIAGFETLEHSINASYTAAPLKEEELARQLDERKDVEGRMVFSQTGNAVVYVLKKGQANPERLASVFLDKTYFSRGFNFKNVSERELYGSIADVLKIAEKPENGVTELKGDVPGFPDQFREPANLFTSVFSD